MIRLKQDRRSPGVRGSVALRSDTVPRSPVATDWFDFPTLPTTGASILDGSTLTELQLDILRVLWEQGEATTQDVHDALAPTRGLAPTTISTLLSRLEKKGVVAHRRQGRQHVYRPLVDEVQVRQSKVKGLTDALFGGDAAALVSHLVRSDHMDEAELARIRKLLDDRTGDQEGGE